jgi:hypothetical protein
MSGSCPGRPGGDHGVHDRHRSQRSGKLVHIKLCPICGTKLYLTFERFAESCGIYTGTVDDPPWFAIGPDNARHILIGVARPDSISPAGIATFHQHAMTNDGVPREPIVFERPHAIGRGD